MLCNSSTPDIPVILSGTLKFLADVVGATFFLVFPFFVFLLCGWPGRFFCSNATLIRSMASSVGTNLKMHGYNNFVSPATLEYLIQSITLFRSFTSKFICSSRV